MRCSLLGFSHSCQAGEEPGQAVLIKPLFHAHTFEPETENANVFPGRRQSAVGVLARRSALKRAGLPRVAAGDGVGGGRPGPAGNSTQLRPQLFIPRRVCGHLPPAGRSAPAPGSGAPHGHPPWTERGAAVLQPHTQERP